MTEEEYAAKEMLPLIGARVEASVALDGMPTLILRHGKSRRRFMLQIMQDPEGNGPGFGAIGHTTPSGPNAPIAQDEWQAMFNQTYEASK